jgi:hypothetical protein
MSGARIDGPLASMKKQAAAGGDGTTADSENARREVRSDHRRFVPSTMRQQIARFHEPGEPFAASTWRPQSQSRRGMR